MSFPQGVKRGLTVSRRNGKLWRFCLQRALLFCNFVAQITRITQIYISALSARH